MEGPLILGGLSVLGIVTIVIAGYLFHNRLATEVDHAQDKEAAADELAKHEVARSAMLERNNAALEQQVTALTTTNKTLVAKLAVAEKLADDLTASVASHPSALPDALRSSLDRLRAEVKVPDVSAAPAGRDSSGGEAGGLHAPAPKRDP